MAEQTAPYGDVKQMVRNLAKQQGAPDTFSVYQVDEELDDWYKKGYKLVNAFYLGQTEAFYSMLYVLAKR